MYIVKIPNWWQMLFPGFLWRQPTREKVIYLTFDDGPIPDVTPWVLDVLHRYDAKATFFCVGDNVHKHPSIFERIITEGHAVGNHTHNHLNGWQTSMDDYIANVQLCAQRVKSRLFRPPYGRLRPRQANALRRLYRLVMWDVLSGDFDTNISGEACFANVVNNAQAGSVIVFHDSHKAYDRLNYALPRVLEYFARQGFRFESLSHHIPRKG